MDNKNVVYMVTYNDDNKQQHLTFVQGFSAVKFLEDRYDRVNFEVTDNYVRETDEDDFYHTWG